MPGLPRAFDMAVATLALGAAAPAIACAALAVKLSSQGPAFFRQERVGLGGKRFRFIKLRTMRVQQSGPQVTAANDNRVTPIGKLLRKTKLDELPELWNVLVGDMALVGPRPEVPRYVDLGDPLWQQVLSARPGLTDPVTMRLRNEEELLARVDGDKESFYRDRLLRWKLQGYAAYLQERSWQSDIGVLVKTALAIVVPPIANEPTLDEVEAATR